MKKCDINYKYLCNEFSYDDVVNFFGNIIQASIEQMNSLVNANYNVRYSHQEALMESVSRPLWGVIFIYLSNLDLNIDFRKINNSILNGVDINSKYYWNVPQSKSQHLVEIVPITLYLLICRKKSFDSFNLENKNRIISWIQNFKKVEYPKNNWIFLKLLLIRPYIF